MKITIIANFVRALDGERDGRFTYLAQEFFNRGYEVELVTSDFYHALKKVRPEPNYEKYPFTITLCHEPQYSKNVSIKRLYSHYVWGHNVLKYIKSCKRTDIIYCAIPSLTVASKLATFCKKNSILFVIDIQDLWPEAFLMSLPKNVLTNAIMSPLKWKANKSYRAADLIIGVSETYVNRAKAVNTKAKHAIPVFLGNDSSVFDSKKGEYKVERIKDELLLCYVGTMSESYDIPNVLYALRLVNEKKLSTIPIRFILIGDGSFRAKFESLASDVYPNTCFLGRKTYTEMAALLASCDIAINPIRKGSAASVINKVGDYALAGIPVINTQESVEYQTLVSRYSCGINCENDNVESIANAIVTIASDSVLRRQMGIASRKLAMEKFNRSTTYRNILDAVDELVKEFEI